MENKKPENSLSEAHTKNHITLDTLEEKITGKEFFNSELDHLYSDSYTKAMRDLTLIDYNNEKPPIKFSEDTLKAIINPDNFINTHNKQILDQDEKRGLLKSLSELMSAKKYFEKTRKKASQRLIEEMGEKYKALSENEKLTILKEVIETHTDTEKMLEKDEKLFDTYRENSKKLTEFILGLLNK